MFTSPNHTPRGDRRVVVVLDNIRSLYNTGSIFRTADASRVSEVILCGITPRPDQGGKQRRAIAKTALGAEETMPWRYERHTTSALGALRDEGFQIAVVETAPAAVDLFTWTPRWPVCLVFGHERDGVSPSLTDATDAIIRIPMLGQKQSLNVATAAGVVLYELVRQRIYGGPNAAPTPGAESP